MCGIVGIITSDDIDSRDKSVMRMVRCLERRGPNGEGIHSWETATLGHRRLAIFDLSARGRQPMISGDGNIGVTFNGAIYNFKDLRALLISEGWRFESDTDTEVLLNGFQAWGVSGLVSRIRGMFAFAIWNNKNRELFLVRDRLGIKPLVYATLKNGIVFASTVNAIRAGGFAHSLNAQAVVDFLEWGVVPEQLSIYQEIEKLPAGSIGHWKDGKFSHQRYWHPSDYNSFTTVSFADAVDQTEALFINAVKRRVEADVPVGALLSGGIDSALVCWALKECGATPKVFTFSAPGEPEDESGDAKQTAAEIGIPITVLQQPNIINPLDELISAYSEPFACGSAIGMLRLSAAAREVITVLLTGDGGDDIFLGYPHHRHLLIAQKLSQLTPNWLSSLILSTDFMPTADGIIRRARHFSRYVAGGLGSFLNARNGLRYYAVEGLLGPRLNEAMPSTSVVKPVTGAGKNVLNNYLSFVQDHQFVAEYLTKVDGATMYHGLEARSPFLDQELWEFAASLPYSIRMHGGKLKAILRAIAKRRISDRVAKGRKRGFVIPLKAWLQGPWSDQVTTLFSNSVLATDGWINPKRLLEWRATEEFSGSHLWNLVVLEYWLQHQNI